MLLSRIQSAFAKNGITLTQDGSRYHAVKGNRFVSFYTNGRESDYVGHITIPHPDTNSSVDLFMDSYLDTIKQAVDYLNPTGELVKPQRGTIETVSEVTVSRNEEKGGIEIAFPGKPETAVIDDLKAHGFRWSPFNKVWWCKYNEANWAWANEMFSKPVMA